MRATTEPTLGELAYAVNIAERVYGAAQALAARLNSRKSGAAAIKAHKVLAAARAAYAKASKMVAS